jgi:uncharacterized membrane protein
MRKLIIKWLLILLARADEITVFLRARSYISILSDICMGVWLCFCYRKRIIPQAIVSPHKATNVAKLKGALLTIGTIVTLWLKITLYLSNLVLISPLIIQYGLKNYPKLRCKY